VKRSVVRPRVSRLSRGIAGPIGPASNRPLSVDRPGRASFAPSEVEQSHPNAAVGEPHLVVRSDSMCNSARATTAAHVTILN
jgi:hypothetical protein